MLKRPVTAVVVNFHGADHTVQAARSIVDDAGPLATVVVVDNSESVAEAERLRAGLPAEVRLRVAASNLGFGRACNLAAQEWPADFIWLVNPDARVLPGCLSALLQAMASDPGLGAVAPMQYLDPAQQWLFSPAWLPTALDEWARERVQRVGPDRLRYDRAVRAETVRLWATPDGARPVRQRALSGSNLLVRQDCIEPRLGLFDPAFFMYFEDSDLCMRLRRQRWRMAVEPAAKALHLWHLGTFKDALMEASRPLYRARHLAGSAFADRRADPRHVASAPEPQTNWAPWISGDWTVPFAWQAGWSLEVSPTPLFSPCIGRLGKGPVVAWPRDVLSAMPGIPLFARLGPLAGTDLPMCRAMA